MTERKDDAQERLDPIKDPILHHFDFIEAQRRQLKEQIARAVLRAVRIERLLLAIEENAETAIRELQRKEHHP